MENKSDDIIDYYYEKGNYFRTIHVDGVSAYITPSDKISFVIYNERFPIPKKLTHKMISDDTEEIIPSSDSKDGIFREIECNLVMDFDVALELKERLDDILEEYISDDDLDDDLGDDDLDDY
ncbi:MAG: hypothetical protein OEZ36_08260 [Spirochaetota bacterium]|nr:hypothetical protein [Spirochaetota bacterium]